MIRPAIRASASAGRTLTATLIRRVQLLKGTKDDIRIVGRELAGGDILSDAGLQSLAQGGLAFRAPLDLTHFLNRALDVLGCDGGLVRRQSIGLQRTHHGERVEEHGSVDGGDHHGRRVHSRKIQDDLRDGASGEVFNL